MKPNTNKPNLETFINIRSTKEEKKEFKDLSDKYGMPLSTYGRDKLFDGKERVFYGKRKLCATMLLIYYISENYSTQMYFISYD